MPRNRHITVDVELCDGVTPGALDGIEFADAVPRPWYELLRLYQ